MIRGGTRGLCCKSWAANWDDDAVLLGDQWLQVWHSKISGHDPAGHSSLSHRVGPLAE